MVKAACDYFRELFTDFNKSDYLKHEKIVKTSFTEEDIVEAIKQCDFNKAIGQDWFYGKMLEDKDVGPGLRKQLLKMLNTDNIPDYLKTARLVLLSKNDKT